jgi:hypothetical protein
MKNSIFVSISRLEIGESDPNPTGVKATRQSMVRSTQLIAPQFTISSTAARVPLGQALKLRLPRAVHPLKVIFTFNAHLEFSYFSY